ncbi:MAG: PDZ domain-containing protein [Pseudomonadota bacterium]
MSALAGLAWLAASGAWAQAWVPGMPGGAGQAQVFQRGRVGLSYAAREEGGAMCIVVDKVLDGPAKSAGILPGDVIVAVGERPIRTMGDALRAFAFLSPGSRETFRLERQGIARTAEVQPVASGTVAGPCMPMTTGGGDVSYVGTCRNGLAHGQGRTEATFQNPNTAGMVRLVYMGEFKDGLQHGAGTLIEISDKGEARWEGGFVDGLMEGEGRFDGPGGESYRGGYRFGKKWGRGMFRGSSGAVFDAQFVEDKVDGPFVMTKDGKRYTGVAVKGAIQGDVKEAP